MILRARNRWGVHRLPLAMLALAITLTAGLAPATASARTVVSLTFDDGLASQAQTRLELSTRGLNATYFVNSGMVGTGAGGSARMTWAELDGLYADGNEIGGKTVDGTLLTGLTPAQQQQQICNDRSALQARGYDALSFAYPGGAYDAG